MTAFMDRCAEIGFLVHFQLIPFEQLNNDPATLNNLTAQVKRFKDHPALFGWCVPSITLMHTHMLKLTTALARTSTSTHLHFCA